jgi:1-acyl-sn-glycerol-3-phosphate acyltransferase
MLFIRSAIYAVYQSITAIIFSLLGVLLWPLPFSCRYRVVSLWARSNLWVLKVVCQIRMEVDGLENIPDEPCVILCKHQSAWETLALQAVFPPQVWVLKRELLWIPFFGWGLASLNPIAIDRKAGRQALNQVIQQGKARLADGAWVVVFPEGTRVASGYIKKFGIGGARLAVESGCPVVPVAHDAGKIWPRQGFIKYPGVVKLTIGTKITTEGRAASDINQQVFEWMSSQMTLLEGKPPVMQARTKEGH